MAEVITFRSLIYRAARSKAVKIPRRLISNRAAVVISLAPKSSTPGTSHCACDVPLSELQVCWPGGSSLLEQIHVYTESPLSVVAIFLLFFCHLS